MPYSSKEELPDNVKELPDKLQDAFLKAFNAAYKQYDGDEEKAFAVAWATVNKMKENSESTPKVRMLNLDISDSQFQSVDNGLLVKDVLVLDEGQWTDSNVGTPLYYTVKALSQFYDNWKQRGVWTRHMGGSPRDITDKAGVVKNTRFMNTGIYADLFFHMRTAKSKDLAELIRSGEVNAVSVEHSGEEEYNPTTRRWESKTLEFYGLAVVDRGACETCVIRKKSKPEPCDIETPLIENEATIMDEETKKMVADMDSRLKGLEESFKKFAEAPTEIPKELSATIEGLTKDLSEAKEKIKQLENTPVEKGIVLPVEPEVLRVKVEPTYKAF